MTRKQEREARRAARQKYFSLISSGMTPKSAKAELNRWGKAKYGAIPWASILAFLAPIIQALIEKWLKV